jgi:hypothetical protein
MKRTLLVVALMAGLLPVWAARPEAKVETLTGKVVALSDVLAKDGGKLDADAVPYWLALRTDDGKLYPLVKDAGSRMFFADKALLNRPMRLTGRLVPGSTLLRVASVNGLHKGELYEVYYWCDICSIKRGEKMICECCGGPMDLKEEPVKP